MSVNDRRLVLRRVVQRWQAQVDDEYDEQEWDAILRSPKGQATLRTLVAQGREAIAQASVVGKSRRQAVCRCDNFAVQDGNEYQCATALGTIAGRAAPTPGPSSAGGSGEWKE